VASHGDIVDVVTEVYIPHVFTTLPCVHLKENMSARSPPEPLSDLSEIRVPYIRLIGKLGERRSRYY